MATDGVQSSSSHMERHETVELARYQFAHVGRTDPAKSTKFVGRDFRVRAYERAPCFGIYRARYTPDFPAIRPPSRERSIQPPTRPAIALPRAFTVQVWPAANWLCLDLPENGRIHGSLISPFLSAAIRSYRRVWSRIVAKLSRRFVSRFEIGDRPDRDYIYRVSSSPPLSVAP